MESPLRIRSILVHSYKILPEQQGGYVKLYVTVEGRTRFMHRLCTENLPCPIFKFSTRYSVLLNLHLELKELFPDPDLPTFPKKKWLGGRSEGFLSKRISQLNDYFTQILQSATINPSEPLMRLISPTRPLNIIVTGGSSVGKQYFIELFIKSSSENYPGNQSKNSMCGQEILKSTPIDLLVDEKLYRIASLDIKTFNGREDQERNFLNEALADKHAVVFMYKERGTAGHGIASRMYEKKKGSIPCILVNCEMENYLNEFSVRNSVDAFNAFIGLIREIKAG
jgi:hypothetical protein